MDEIVLAIALSMDHLLGWPNAIVQDVVTIAYMDNVSIHHLVGTFIAQDI